MLKIILIGFLSGLLILICNTIVSKIIQGCFHYRIQAEKNNTKVTIDLSKNVFIPLYLVMVVIEEWLYRYLLFEYLNSIWNSLLLSILVSTIVFTIMHFHYRYKMIQIFIMGVILCISYIMTKSIICPIIAHFINNFTIVYLLNRNEYK